jgi:hypothetical protein
MADTPVQRLKQPGRRSARSCGISITGSEAPDPAERRDDSPRMGASHHAQIGAVADSSRPCPVWHVRWVGVKD